MQGCNKNGFHLFMHVQKVFIFTALLQDGVANVCAKFFISHKTRFTHLHYNLTNMLDIHASVYKISIKLLAFGKMNYLTLDSNKYSMM